MVLGLDWAVGMLLYSPGALVGRNRVCKSSAHLRICTDVERELIHDSCLASSQLGEASVTAR
jgi:hypothetical protein